ncbi:prolactin receptor-like [Seriola lalandi dorsalis]|uniref:Prolactin receptor-like n=1 Tax=Seriola lalandi dorsalis TaxID=1841481 RepID=A0A3B4XCT5_SERLL|nr:prolactin receptor-like [Seriola lalandi dorsalis]
MVTVTVMEDRGWPFLRVSWEPPHKADTRSGWITLIYELRVKLEGEDDWEMHLAGQQKMFNVFSLRSGGRYHIQVRCKPDHGFWSEWSSTSEIKVPDCKISTNNYLQYTTLHSYAITCILYKVY